MTSAHPAPLFIVGAPRSGTTIVAQALNTHDEIKIFDEISLIDGLIFDGALVGTLGEFLLERRRRDDYDACIAAGDPPAIALRHALAACASPKPIWGEKNPMYATRLATLRQGFPGARFLFVIRDPREVVNSYLGYRAATARSRHDFWIKDTVADALALVASCFEPLDTASADVSILRYEDFVAAPAPALMDVFSTWNLRFSADALAKAHSPPDTFANMQFFRGGAPLPWKLANLSPIKGEPLRRDRIDPHDEAWAKVDALAAKFGYAN